MSFKLVSFLHLYQ